MYVIEYKDLHELLELIPKPEKRIKNIDVNYVHSDYDVFIIYDEKNSFVGAYTQDLLFAKTIRQTCLVDGLQNVKMKNQSGLLGNVSI